MVKHPDNRKTLKTFGITSSIIFTIIVTASILWIQSTDRNSTVFIQVINIIILSSGVIGLGYCIIMLRTFDVKTDTVITEKLLDDLDLNGEENNDMTWENSDKDKKMLCF